MNRMAEEGVIVERESWEWNGSDGSWIGFEGVMEWLFFACEDGDVVLENLEWVVYVFLDLADFWGLSGIQFAF